MKRRTFLNFPHTSDCCEYNEVEIEEGPRFVDDPCLGGKWYTLTKYPSNCKCGHPIHVVDPSQAELKAAWELPEAEDAE